MIDELAHAAGKDPVEFRLALLDGAGENAGGAKRLANALRTAVGRPGYGATSCRKNEGIGVACVLSQERATATWTACVAHVEVDPANGEVKVKKLTLAMDVGTVVNPDGVRAQIEGSALWGTVAGAVREGDAGERRASGDQLRRLHAAADEPDAGTRHQHHRQRRPGGRAAASPAVTVVAPAHRQRHLQRGRRPRALAADHGGGGEGGHEGVRRPRHR